MMIKPERIQHYEQILDRVLAAAKRMEEAKAEFSRAQADLSNLEQYYTSPEWKEDYEADEAGMLPPDLKRGVLSQDGIDHALEWMQELKERRVRLSAKALTIRNGRMLACRLRDSEGVYYIMPGGGQIPGELLPETVEREVAEETGIRVKAGDIVFAIEGAEGEEDHRVDLVFQCEYIGPADTPMQADHLQTGTEWLEIKTLNTAPLYPSRLRRAIMNLYGEEHSRIYLGNENIGDPEIST